jgi:hypothetical protein
MPDNFIRRAAAILCLLLCVAAWPAAGAQDKASDTYPEQGKVLAHAASQKPSAHGTPVFRVETDLKIYEFEAKDPSSLAVGDTIQFRVEKDSAYVQRAGKEQEFRVIDTMLKDGD